MDENAQITALTRLKPDEIDDALRWFGRQARPVQLAVLREPVALKYPEGSTKVPADIRRFAALALGAFRLFSREVTTMKRKNLERDLEAHADLHRLRVDAIKIGTRRRKKSPKEEAIRIRLGLIDNLRTKDRLTWRQVAAYLKLHAGLEVAPGYLHACVSRLKGLEALMEAKP